MAKGDTDTESNAMNQPPPQSEQVDGDRPIASGDVPNKGIAPDEVLNAVVFHMNGDGSFTPIAGELPAGCGTAQDALSAWNATSAGEINMGTSWLTTFRLPAERLSDDLLGGARGLGLMHWSDGTQALIVLDQDTDIARLQDVAHRLARGDGALNATFDANGNPI
jgi:hypothetical protein